jgi:hypothetical protein
VSLWAHPLLPTQYQQLVSKGDALFIGEKSDKEPFCRIFNFTERESLKKSIQNTIFAL